VEPQALQLTLKRFGGASRQIRKMPCDVGVVSDVAKFSGPRDDDVLGLSQPSRSTAGSHSSTRACPFVGVPRR
jgi:hypothetical protein